MNNGSVDGDPQASSRYCVTGDTLVNTDKGLIEISNIVDNQINSDNDIDITVKSIDGTNKAIKLFNSGVHDIIKVETKKGYTIKGSENHPILVLTKDENSKPVLAWKKLENVNIGDYAVINCKEATVSSNIDLVEEWEAKFLGGLISEGFISSDKQRYWRVGFSNSDKEFLDVMEDGFKKYLALLNKDVKVRVCNKDYNDKFFRDITVDCKDLYDYLKDNFEITFGSDSKTVPSKILKSSLNIQKVFLKYLFEGDGCVSISNRGKDNEYISVAYASKSKKLVQQIQTMLLQFDILSSTTSIDKRNGCSVLIISGVKNVTNFKNNIGFLSERKNNDLNRVEEVGNKKTGFSSSEFVPYISDYIRNKNKAGILKRYNFDRKNNFNLRRKDIEASFNKDELNLLLEFFDKNFVYLPIIKKEKLAKECVYSVKVDSECHSFVANGFINHNTEARISKISDALLQDVDTSVEKHLTFTNREEEPIVLSGMVPTLLLNGAMGISVGYTTKIPSHNLNEICDGLINYIQKDLDIDGILKYIKGPDFAGGAILSSTNIPELYKTGTAKLSVKAKYVIEQNKSGNTQIVFTELPPYTKKPDLIKKIYELCIETKEIPRVIDVRDITRNTDIRIVVELHKTAIPELVVKELFDKTELKKNITYVMRAIKENAPVIFNIKELFDVYINHRRECITKNTEYTLKILRNKLHIQEGLNKVTNNIKRAVEIINDSENDNEAAKALIAEFDLSEEQANNVLDMKLRKLTKLNKQDIIDLIASLNTEIKDLEDVLENINLVDDIIVHQLKDLKKKFGDERRTEIIDEQEIIAEEVMTNDPIALVLTNKNAIKHITIKALDDMFKNGALKERQDVFVQGIKCKMNDDFILIFDNGEFAKIQFNDLMNLSFIEKRKIKCILALNDETKEKLAVIMTRKGVVQKLKLDNFRARNKKCTTLIKDFNDDEIISVRIVDENKDNIITISTKNGLVHRFYEQSFKDSKSPGSKGLSGITLSDDDEVVGFDITVFDENDNKKIVLFTKFEDNTYGMKTMDLKSFSPKGRISKGVSAISYSKKLNGCVSNMVITDKDFFTLDYKGIATVYKFDTLTSNEKYSKPEKINNEINITDFFLI